VALATGPTEEEEEILPDECGKQEDEAVRIGPFTDMCLLGGGAVVPMLPLVQHEGSND